MNPGVSMRVFGKLFKIRSLVLQKRKPCKSGSRMRGFEPGSRKCAHVCGVGRKSVLLLDEGVLDMARVKVDVQL